MPDLPISVSPSDLDPQWVKDAYRFISMMADEPRIERFQREYVAHITEVYDDLAPLVETDEQRTILAEGIEAYRVRYLELMRAWLYAKSRTSSSFVQGPARFNHRANAKRLATDDRRFAELDEFTRAQPKRLRKALLAARPEQSVEEAEFRRLRSAAISVIGTLKGIETGKVHWAEASLFRRSLAGKLRSSYKAGHVEAVRRVLAFVREVEGEHLQSPVFAARNKVWEMERDRDGEAGEDAA